MTAFVSNAVLHASRLSQDIATAAQRAAHACLPTSINWKTRAQDGGMSLWVWCDGLELYCMGKERGVFFTPGRYFFLGSDQEHPWMKRCLRISLTQPAETLEYGLTILLAGCMGVLRDSATTPSQGRSLARTAYQALQNA